MQSNKASVHANQTKGKDLVTLEKSCIPNSTQQKRNLNERSSATDFNRGAIRDPERVPSDFSSEKILQQTKTKLDVFFFSFDVLFFVHSLTCFPSIRGFQDTPQIAIAAHHN